MLGQQIYTVCPPFLGLIHLIEREIPGIPGSKPPKTKNRRAAAGRQGGLRELGAGAGLLRLGEAGESGDGGEEDQEPDANGAVNIYMEEYLELTTWIPEYMLCKYDILLSQAHVFFGGIQVRLFACRQRPSEHA